MHSSGIYVSDTVSKQFAAAQNSSSSLFLKYQIQNDAFVKTGEGNSTSSRSSDFLEIQKALDETVPSYIVARSEVKDKWLLVYYMPDKSSVRDRMLYSCSVTAFKDGLGTSSFVPAQYSITCKSDCTYDGYLASIKSSQMTEEEKFDILTDSERMQMLSEQSTQLSSVKVAAIVGLPIPVSEDASQALQSFQQKQIKTLILSLNSENETLLVDVKDNLKVDQVQTKLTGKEPRFILQSFTYKKDGNDEEATVFIYYCPSEIKPKLKMFYSTSKSYILKVLQKYEIEITKSIELSDMKEISESNFIQELAPVQVQVKAIAKAAKPGRKGTSRLIGGAKFQDNAADEE